MIRMRHLEHEEYAFPGLFPKKLRSKNTTGNNFPKLVIQIYAVLEHTKNENSMTYHHQLLVS